MSCTYPYTPGQCGVHIYIPCYFVISGLWMRAGNASRRSFFVDLSVHLVEVRSLHQRTFTAVGVVAVLVGGVVAADAFHEGVRT